MSTETHDLMRKASEILGDLVRTDEPIGVRTTYRVGGRAALFVEIDSSAALERVAEAVSITAIDCLVLGKGSNLLVADAGFDGLCVTLGEAYAGVTCVDGDTVVLAGASVPYPVLARQTAAMGLSKMEWAVGIPGSVGGAVRMNAGGHGSSTADRLISASVVDLAHGTARTHAVGELGLSYRASNLSSSELVVSASFALEPGEIGNSEKEINAIVRWRREHQPGGRNGGSVFANPLGDAAGRLIEQAGLKGARIGSAEVSPKHANFFTVDDNGRADDVFSLIEFVREQVARRLGVELTIELKVVGYSR